MDLLGENMPMKDSLGAPSPWEFPWTSPMAGSDQYYNLSGPARCAHTETFFMGTGEIHHLPGSNKCGHEPPLSLKVPLIFAGVLMLSSVFTGGHAQTWPFNGGHIPPYAQGNRLCTYAVPL